MGVACGIQGAAAGVAGGCVQQGEEQALGIKVLQGSTARGQVGRVPEGGTARAMLRRAPRSVQLFQRISTQALTDISSMSKATPRVTASP